MLGLVKRLKKLDGRSVCHRRRSTLTVVLLGLLSITGCGGGGAEARTPATEPADQKRGVTLLPSGNAPQFKFRALDGREVSSDVIPGRNTVLAFLATFDWASQAQARFLSGIERNHRPRTNCYAIVLERPENDMLVESFVQTLSLRYPVAHVPADKLAKTELRDARAVPSVWVFDAGGNVVWKSRGLATEEVLNRVLREVEGNR